MVTGVVASLVVQHQNISTIIFAQLWWCIIKIFPPLYSPNFGGATSKYFHHYIRPTLSETEVITDIAVLHMGTNDIINSEVNKDLEADSIINIARECVAFGVKSVFISSLTVNTQRNSAFISAVNKTLTAKCLMHNFHFIENSNIKKEHIWKDGLHLNCSGKDWLSSNFLRDINNLLRNLKDQEIVT